MRRSHIPRVFLALAAGLAVGVSSCGGGGDGAAIGPFFIHGGVLVTDLDGDGRVDVAVVMTYIAGPPPHPGTVGVYRRLPSGAFAPRADYAVGPDPWGLSAGDFDGDGRLDLVAATSSTVPPAVNAISNSGGVALVLQGANGTFQPMRWIATGSTPTDAAVADANGDGLPDLVVADGVLISGRAQLFAQDPSAPGQLLPAVSLLAGSGNGSSDLAIGDVDGDGRMDVVLAATNIVAIFYQQPGGGFGPVVSVAAGLRVSGVAIGDLDGDGRSDIAVANAGNAPDGGTGGSTLTLLLQTTPGAFQTQSIALPDGARRVAIGDLNGDGVPDVAAISLVYQSQSPARVSVVLQSPTLRGQFALSGVYDGTFSGDAIALGDINNDGLTDIVINEGPSVMLQRPTARGTFAAPGPLP